MKSPLSEKPPEKIRDLPRKLILEQLEHYYQQKPPAEVVETDYSIWRCSETGLEFAWPMRPGNLEFYKWISQFDSYYPGLRWEYGEVRKLIGPDTKVLDVGCGEGDFLKSLGGSAGNRYALDMNEPAVKKCRQLGFSSFCGTIESAVQAGFMHEGQFPVVASFHCLEHVDDPVGFVGSMLKAVSPDGRLFVSTPYSPMSFETEWFDIMNHPPHHMTRWNLRAYRKLAELLKVQMRHFTPASTSQRRALDTFKLLRYGPHRPYKKTDLARNLVLHAATFGRILSAQRKRAEKNDGIAADVILVEFTR